MWLYVPYIVQFKIDLTFQPINQKGIKSLSKNLISKNLISKNLISKNLISKNLILKNLILKN
ncbi:MAG: hypothetical protein RI894_1733 [Bacteroidota bacterium]|jgi:hypothetical protein